MIWPWFECFPGDSKVTILGSSGYPVNISIADLKISDKVLIGLGDDNKPKFSKVVSFFHNLPGVSAKFVRLHTDENFITLTPLHLILSKGKLVNDFEFLPAADVKAGDSIKLFNHHLNQLKSVLVLKVDVFELKNSGVYAPLTETGTIIVDSFQASCFALVKSHNLTQMFYTVLNILSYILTFKSDTYMSISKLTYDLVDFLNLKAYFLNL